MNRIKSLVRAIPDFPKAGILFRDITPLLEDKNALKEVVESFREEISGGVPQKIVAVESRGFIFGGALALVSDAGFVPVRKKGKLPWDTLSAEYALEYGTDVLEIHKDAIKEGDRVVIVDDLLATGGTALAACQLVKQCGGIVEKVLFLIELDELNGRDRLKGYDVFSLLHF